MLLLLLVLSLQTPPPPATGQTVNPRAQIPSRPAKPAVNPRVTVPEPQQPALVLSADPSPAQVGEDVTFTVKFPASNSAEGLTFTYTFGDDPRPQPGGPSAGHRYGAAGNYTVNVSYGFRPGLEVFTMPFRQPQPIELQVTHAPLSASTTSILAGEAVTFSTRFRSADRAVVYRLLPGDGTSPAASPSPTATHTYDRAGSFPARMEIARQINATLALVDTSDAVTIVVAQPARANPPAPRPGPTPAQPTQPRQPPPPPPPGSNWWLWLVGLLPAGWLGHRVWKQISAPRPQFTPAADIGSASIEGGPRALDFDVQIVFDRNVADAHSEILTGATGLVTSVRNRHA